MAWTTPRTWVSGEIVTAAIGNTHWRDNFNILKTVIDDTGDLRFVDATELTIAADAITVTQNYHKVDTQADAATDDLSTITAGTSVAAGFVLVLRAENTARVVTVKDGVGNVLLNGGDIALDATDKLCTLIYDGANWRGGSWLSRSDGSLRESFRGLHLRTSPDADVAATTVALIHADELVMDDGVRVATWDRLSAVISSAGAGGLDTGAEAASAWYEVYAIRKSSDGTKNLLLHRSKDWTSDVSFTTTTDAGRALRLSTATATDKLAQGLQFASSKPFVEHNVQLIRTGAVSGNIWFTLESDTAGAPSGSVLATSDKMDAAIISTSNQVLRVIFRTPYTVTATTQYHLVLQGDYAKSDTVYISWRGVIAGGYANGSAQQYNGAAWIAAVGVGDFYFNCFCEFNNVSVTMPSGYDQKCKVGYVYNDSGSNLNPFVQLGHKVMPLELNDLGSVTATVPTLTDISTTLPPVPALFGVRFNNNTAGKVSFIGQVPDGYVTGPDVRTSGCAAYANQDANENGFVFVLTEMQAVYLSVDAASTLSVKADQWEWF